MTDDDDFDVQLAAQFAGEEELPDAGFSAALLARLEQHHRRRQHMLSIVAVMTVICVAIAFAWLPASAVTLIATPANAIAVLVLAAACSVIWIATEPGIDVRRLR